DDLLAFTSSLDFDRRLAGDDIAGSRAHVAMLGHVGLLSDEEVAAVTTALDPTDEDIHTAIERRVIDLAGPAGAKLHTGRSRNDQVALDLRLFLRREGRAVAAAVHELQGVLVRRATDAG